MQQQKIKPAVILDDDSDWATNIGRGIRRFGGLPVKYFPSIESFYRAHDLQYGDKAGLVKVLGDYSVVVSDNNFEVYKPPVPGDGMIRGADFLLGQLGPALKDIPKEERPIVMCFAPSSQAVIKQYEKAMWDEYEIVSFHKLWETAAVGLEVRIARETGVVLSREALIQNICQQSLTEDAYGSPKADFFFNLRADHTEFDDFPDEHLNQVEGAAKPMKWEEILTSLAGRLNTDSDTLSRTVKREVEQRRVEIEGIPNQRGRTK